MRLKRDNYGVYLRYAATCNVMTSQYAQYVTSFLLQFCRMNNYKTLTSLSLTYILGLMHGCVHTNYKLIGRVEFYDSKMLLFYFCF
jgi:hypothetical protein